MIYPVTIEGIPFNVESDYGIGDRVLICGDATRAATVIELAGLCPDGHPLWVLSPDARPDVDLFVCEGKFAKRMSA